MCCEEMPLRTAGVRSPVLPPRYAGAFDIAAQRASAKSEPEAASTSICRGSGLPRPETEPAAETADKFWALTLDAEPEEDPVAVAVVAVAVAVADAAAPPASAPVEAAAAPALGGDASALQLQFCVRVTMDGDAVEPSIACQTVVQWQEGADETDAKPRTVEGEAEAAADPVPADEVVAPEKAEPDPVADFIAAALADAIRTLAE